MRNIRSCTQAAPAATSAAKSTRAALRSGVVLGSEIMKKAKRSSAPLWRRWKGIASGSPSTSDRATRRAA